MIRLIVLIVALSQVTLTAQGSGGWQFGMRIGPNFAKMERTDYSSTGDDSYLSGISTALVVIRPVKEGRDFGMELQYNMAGSDFGRPFPGLFYDGDYTTYRLHYLTIPVYYRFKSRIATLIEDFDFILGASCSYLFAARQKVVTDTEQPLETGPSDIRSQLNHFDYGLLTGISLPVWRRHMGLSLRYYYGFNRVVRKSAPLYPDAVPDRGSMKNRWLLLGFEAYF